MAYSTYMEDMRHIFSIVNEDVVTKFLNFHILCQGTSLLMALGNRRTNGHKSQSADIKTSPLVLINETI